MPQPTGWVELEAAAIVLGVDDEHPTGADQQVDAPMAVNSGWGEGRRLELGVAAEDGEDFSGDVAL